MPPRIAVRDIAFFERPVPFVEPFRFGAVVINAASQVFVRVEIEVEGKGVAVGASAELMAPKWFDKRAQLSPEQTVEELRRSLEIARGLYLAVRDFETAFGLHARLHRGTGGRLRRRKHSSARRRLRAGRNRQGAAGRRAALLRGRISSTA